jgi:hypothetical protein
MLTALREQTAPAKLTRKISPCKAVTGLKINYQLSGEDYVKGTQK